MKLRGRQRAAPNPDYRLWEDARRWYDRMSAYPEMTILDWIIRSEIEQREAAADTSWWW